MDADRFDTLARAMQTTPTRRLTLGALTALGLATLLGDDEAEAKKKGGKKKGVKCQGKSCKKKRECKLIGRECCSDRDCSDSTKSTCCQRAYCAECCSQADCDLFYPGQGLTCNFVGSCEDCSPERALCSNDIECCSLHCFIPDGEAFGECSEPT